MYKIIGGDGGEYGPVAEETIRQWMAEGRLDGGTRIKPEGAAEWTTLGALPEFSGALAATAAPALERRPEGSGALDAGSCFNAAWALFKERMWLLVGAMAVFLVLNLVVQFLLGIVQGVFVPGSVRATPGQISLVGWLVIGATALAGGIFTQLLIAGGWRFLLNLVRRREASIGDIFTGMGEAPVAVVAGAIVSMILILLGYCLCILPGIYLTLGYAFFIPLILDRRMGFWEALETSRKAVTPQWLPVLLLGLITIGLGILGVLACFVGILFAAPLSYLMWAYAYEDLFGGEGAGGSRQA